MNKKTTRILYNILLRENYESNILMTIRTTTITNLLIVLKLVFQFTLLFSNIDNVTIILLIEAKLMRENKENANYENTKHLM